MVSGQTLRTLSLDLPEAVEEETWGHPTFRVGGHIFAGLDEDGTTATVKASKDVQQQLIASDPGTFGIAPHVGVHGWVSVELSRIDEQHLEHLVVEAWRSTASKSAVAAFDGSGAG